MSNFVALLVEDDPLQREVVARVLQSEGLKVIECSTAEAAELIVASTGNELKALVTDYNLAGRMTGAELADFARGRHPDLRIIVMSGNKVRSLPANSMFLGKPFLPSQLLEAVKI